MYSFSEAVSPRASSPVNCGRLVFTPVHQGSHAHTPGLTHGKSPRRFGVARFAMRSELTKSAAVRPIIKTRHGLTRGTSDTKRPFQLFREASLTPTFSEPVPVVNMPAQSSKSASDTATYAAGVSTSSGRVFHFPGGIVLNFASG